MAGPRRKRKQTTKTHMSNGNSTPEKQQKHSKKTRKQKSRKEPQRTPGAQDFTRAISVMSKQGLGPTRKQLVKYLKRGGSTYGLSNVNFMAWVRQLANPFRTEVVKCPVNFNPVPTVLTMPAVTVSTGSFVVDKGASREIVLMPGHTEEASVDPMDGEAYHAAIQTTNAGDRSIGPVDTNLGAGCGMLMSLNRPQDQLPESGSTYAPVGWDNPLPFQGVAYDAGHLRWKLTAMGFKWKNNTSQLARGGNVKSVQPPIAFTPPNSGAGGPGWAGYDRFPSYNLYKGLDDQVSWIPRIEDLSFWHLGSGTTISTSNGGIRVLFTAPSDNSQSYEYELICKWEIGGSSIATLSSAAELVSSHRDVAEDFIGHLANTSHTAAPAVNAVQHTSQQRVTQDREIFGASPRSGGSYLDTVKKGIEAGLHIASVANHT